MILTIGIFIAVHLALALVASIFVVKLDLVEQDQKKAQIIVGILIPFIGSLFIIAFSLYEKSSQLKEMRRLTSRSSSSNESGIDLHVAQRQHENVSSGD